MSDGGRYYLADAAELDAGGVDIGPPTLVYPGEGGSPDERQPTALFGDGIPDGR